MDKQQTAL